MLFLRSLIDCLFGTGNESKADLESGWDGRKLRISYAKYPTLPGVILGLLKSGRRASDVESQQKAAESVFPALDILRRAGPPDHLHDELYGCVVEYLGSNLWHVREMAARTACSFLIGRDWVVALAELFRVTGGGYNALHGTLLTAKYVLERVIDLGTEDFQRELRPSVPN